MTTYDVTVGFDVWASATHEIEATSDGTIRGGLRSINSSGRQTYDAGRGTGRLTICLSTCPTNRPARKSAGSDDMER